MQLMQAGRAKRKELAVPKQAGIESRSPVLCKNVDSILAEEERAGKGEENQGKAAEAAIKAGSRGQLAAGKTGDSNDLTARGHLSVTGHFFSIDIILAQHEQ